MDRGPSYQKRRPSVKKKDMELVNPPYKISVNFSRLIKNPIKTAAAIEI